MTDITNRLRDPWEQGAINSRLMFSEAADEIDTLRGAIRTLAGWVRELDPHPSLDPCEYLTDADESAAVRRAFVLAIGDLVVWLRGDDPATRFHLDQWNERPGAEGSTVIDEKWSEPIKVRCVGCNLVADLPEDPDRPGFVLIAAMENWTAPPPMCPTCSADRDNGSRKRPADPSLNGRSEDDDA